MAGLHYDEFQPGKVIEHGIRRTVTESDNLLMTALTHNPARLHLDAEYMRGTEFGQVIVNSCFTLSLMIGISVNETTFGTAIANLGLDEIRFPSPVFVGDTLRVETEIRNKRAAKSRPNAGIVTFIHRAYNQRDEEVAVCTRVTMVRKRACA